MHWVYLLKLEDSNYYVGETKRLYRRMKEHFKQGVHSSIHCSDFKPLCILGFYKVKSNSIYKYYSEQIKNGTADDSFIFNLSTRLTKHFRNSDCPKSDALELENEICLHKMKVIRNRWHQVQGGKYCGNVCNNPSTDFKFTRPCCHCPGNIPAEIHMYKNKMYFRCVKKGMGWFDMTNDEI